MILQILKKDWKLSWPMVVLVTAIQLGLEWADRGHSPAAAALLRPMTLAWYLSIAALAAGVVLTDPIPGADQDWLIRPLSRTQLLLAKLAFVGLAVCLPMFVLNMSHPLALGFSFARSLEMVFYKELYLFACFILPVMALAAVSQTMSECIGIGAALIVVYALSLSMSAFFFGADWCPTCDSGVSWLQHLLQHAEALVGAGVILGLQYYYRRTHVARAVAVCGAAALVFIQLPWSTALALQTWVTGPGTVQAPTLAFDQALPDSESVKAGRDTTSGIKKTSNLLMHGEVGQALSSLRHHGDGDASVSLELALRIQGASADELLLVDRLGISLVGEGGRMLYERPAIATSPEALVAYPRNASTLAGVLHQTVEVPGAVARETAAHAVQLQMHYALTLLEQRGEYRLPAVAGSVQAPDLGRCTSRLDEDNIEVGCAVMGRTPFCYGITLYGPDGRHNPEVLRCIPDYRPYLPAPTSVVNLYGEGVPVRDRNGVQQYAVDGADLAAAYLIVRLYEQQRHFKADLVSAPFALAQAGTH